jgi:hypothetical protein
MTYLLDGQFSSHVLRAVPSSSDVVSCAKRIDACARRHSGVFAQIDCRRAAPNVVCKRLSNVVEPIHGRAARVAELIPRAEHDDIRRHSRDPINVVALIGIRSVMRSP